MTHSSSIVTKQRDDRGYISWCSLSVRPHWPDFLYIWTYCGSVSPITDHLTGLHQSLYITWLFISSFLEILITMAPLRSWRSCGHTAAFLFTGQWKQGEKDRRLVLNRQVVGAVYAANQTQRFPLSLPPLYLRGTHTHMLDESDVTYTLTVGLPARTRTFTVELSPHVLCEGLMVLFILSDKERCCMQTNNKLPLLPACMYTCPVHSTYSV